MFSLTVNLALGFLPHPQEVQYPKGSSGDSALLGQEKQIDLRSLYTFLDTCPSINKEVLAFA